MWLPFVMRIQMRTTRRLSHLLVFLVPPEQYFLMPVLLFTVKISFGGILIGGSLVCHRHVFLFVGGQVCSGTIFFCSGAWWNMLLRFLSFGGEVGFFRYEACDFPCGSACKFQRD